ncbi:MAG: hypothetical protein AAF322_02370 [Pseudomonadota bacterium]
MKEGTRRGLILSLKLLLPLAALAILGSIFLFSNARFGAGVSFEGVDASKLEEGLRITNPSFTGETDKGEPFTVSAAWALPDGPRPERVELSDVTGEITLEDGRVVTLGAAGGVLQPQAKVLDLSGGARFASSDGYEITAETARFDAEAETLSAAGGVVATGPIGSIASETMRVERVAAPDGENEDEDAYIWFENRVKVRIDSARMARAPG